MRFLKETFESIGGPWLLDRLQSVLVGIPIVVILSVIFPRDYTWDQYILTFLRNILIFGYVLIVSELARRTIFSRIKQQPANPLLVLSFGALLGATVYLLTEATGLLLGVPVEPVGVGSILISALIGSVVVALGSLLEKLRRWSRIRRRLNLERQADVVDKEQIAAQLSMVFSDLSADVSRKFNELRMNRAITSKESLERVITECIKPLSRSLTSLTRPTARYFVIRGTTSEALALRPFQAPTAVAFVFSAGFLLVNALLGNGNLALEPALIGFLIVSVVLNFSERLWPKFGRGKGLLAIVTVASALAAIVTPINQYYLLSSFEPVRLLAGWLLNLTVIATILVISATVAYRPKSTNSEYAQILDANAGGALRQAFNALIYRRLSQKLHGAVQSDVLALQLSIDDSLLSASKELERNVLEIIEKARQDFLSETEKPLGERLEELAEMWSFVAKIEISNSCENLSALQENVCFMVIQEAVTNSVRHGSADLIEVHLSSDEPGCFQLYVIDNGTGPIGKGSKPGAGLKVLSALTEDEYSLGFNKNGGARLSATIYA
jgi:signal transduction histidine kinase